MLAASPTLGNTDLFWDTSFILRECQMNGSSDANRVLWDLLLSLSTVTLRSPFTAWVSNSSLGTDGLVLYILLWSFILESWEDGTKRGVMGIHYMFLPKYVFIWTDWMSSRENVRLYGEYIFIFPRGKQQFLVTLLPNLLFYGVCFVATLGNSLPNPGSQRFFFPIFHWKT